ncbi:MAG: 2-oxo acid dehydrogenase subunit E2 [Pirellulaceae bacterium]
MIFELKMPDLTTNDSPVRIVRWIAHVGDVIERGQPLLEAETDKATMEVESAIRGKLDRVLCQADEEVAVGQVIALFEIAGGPPAAPAAPATAREAQLLDPPNLVPVTAWPSGGGPPEQPAGPSERPPGGMFARNRAAASAEKRLSVPLPLSVAQRTAAKRLQSSKQTIPHFYLQTSFDASAIVSRRKAAEPLKLVWDAFFVQAVARTLGRFDRFRYRFEGEQLVPADCEGVGVAIDMDNELFVVPVAAPAGKSVEQISEEIRGAVERLRSGDQEARRVHAALMTVTNLGICNVESFVPIINPPEAAILGVGKVMLMPVARDDGQLVARHRCALTLCVDHRVVSGKYAGNFLGAIVEELEDLNRKDNA